MYESVDFLEGEERTLMNHVFQVGEQVRVTSYSPFRGLKGVVRKVDTFSSADEPFYFYLVNLEGSYTKEPIWFEPEEVEPLAS